MSLKIKKLLDFCKNHLNVHNPIKKRSSLLLNINYETETEQTEKNKKLQSELGEAHKYIETIESRLKTVKSNKKNRYPNQIKQDKIK